ncbi:MAG: bifunctional DNA primase/polymerase [Pseudomonadota bacterium]|jgi:hypothetical protein|nr:bifunctional DNA primase/polymerase [Pseudomonadota bacterium]
MLDLALHYAARGWPVFPLVPNGKKPLSGSHGCLDAALDANRIERWWAEHPTANVGIATGRRSGLLVVDIDPRHNPQWLDALRELNLPRTFTVRTWSGGWHLYYQSTGDGPSSGTVLLPGIDWRCNGGYVVAPGSSVEDAQYTIARNLPIAPAPALLLARIEAHRKVRRIEHDAAGRMVIASGKRNETLLRIACAVRRWGVEQSALLDCLRAVNAAHCDPALSDEELTTIAASAARYAPAEQQERRATR